ncbi:MAG: hypothetical protein AB1478_07930 [Nitrospirota bacterium]
MTVEDLHDEINIELESIEATLRELSSLQNDIDDRDPTVREKTAAASFMAQFYSGIENILKRISRFQSVPLPTGETWHIELFNRFCTPSFKGLPILFDESLALSLSPFRKFRHVVFHGYGFQLDWERMKEGMGNIEEVFQRFRGNLLKYLQTLKEKK